MPKTITSPVELFSGTVTLSDPMDIQQALIFERALRAVKELQKSKAELLAEFDAAVLPGILACVEKWELKSIGNPPAPFPASPRAESAELILWLWNQIIAIWNGSGEVQEEEKNA